MRSRSRSIRSKLVLLLLVPLISLTALWGFSASITLGPGLSLLHVTTLVDFAKMSDSLTSALQDERRAAAVQAARPTAANLHDFAAKRRATDDAKVSYFRTADSAEIRSAIKPQAVDDIAAYRLDIEKLDNIRGLLARGGASVPGVMSAYTTALSASYQVTASTIITFGDADFARKSNDVLDFARARDALSQEDAVMAAMLAHGGMMTAQEHARFAEALGVQRYEYAQVIPKLSPELRSRYAGVVASPAFVRMRGVENRIANQTHHGAAMHVMPEQWQAATSQVLKQQQAILLSGADELSTDGQPIAIRILGQLAATALFGLIAVVASLVISVRISRSLIRELTALRHSARDVADQRLPAVVRRLRQGEQIDVDAEIVSSTYKTREIAQLGAAFGSVQRTAMEEAVGEARMRTGIRDVFVNLARRSQALLHRQLKLLDGMERRADDPDELERLFQLDHLATRMRRHAEGLIILSGSTPGRNWRRPVPMVDVMRAAIAEVEDYPRVTVLPMPDAALSGPAVADVVHLVAELVENATLYSPPHTEVRISAEHVGNGYVVEIDDRGLSMSAEDLQAANQRLSDPPEFDLSDSARLGLFVVGRLARRHGIRVSLRVSPYGGTTGIVLLPGDLVITDETTVVDTGPFGERVRPAGVGYGADDPDALDADDPPSGGHLHAAPDLDDRPAVASVPDAPGGPDVWPANDWENGALAEEAQTEAPAAPEAEPRYSAEPPAAPYPTTANGLPRRVRAQRRDAQERSGPPAEAPDVPGRRGQDTGAHGVGAAVPFAAGPPEPRQAPDVAWPSEDAGTPVRDPFVPLSAVEPAPPASPQAPPPEPRRGMPPRPPRRDDDAVSGGDATPAESVRGAPPVGDDAVRDTDPGDAVRPGAGDSGEEAPPPLPKRVRQSHLAPQLRTDVRAGDLELDLTESDPAGGRSPEEARAMMASIQQGWLRGRAQDPGQPQAGEPAEEEDI
ncbi:MAG TPA: nitrate- and nitrite sensing domain-containing protein [Streptosporangiaceae bacterium]|jgi:signal transduction histidine kinase